MKRAAPVLLALFSITALVVATLLLRPHPTVAPFPRSGLTLPVSLPTGDFVSDRVEQLAREATRPLSPAVPVPEAVVAAPPVASATAESVAGPLTSPASETATNPEDIPQPEPPPISSTDERQAARDKAFLEARNSEIAFVDLGGEISGKKIAMFHFIETKEKKTAIEGGEINSLKVVAVSDNSARLGYGLAEPISKPRIQLEIGDDPDKPLTEAEKQARLVRYQELWGNRFMAAARESGADVRASELDEPPSAEQEAARRKYWETYQEYFEKVRAQDPSVDPREIPRPDLDPDTAVKKYFETHWPDQIEVTTETAPENGEHP